MTNKHHNLRVVYIVLTCNTWISKGVNVVYIFPFQKIISRHLCNFFFFCFLCLSTKEFLGSISGMSDDHPTKCQLKKPDKLELEHCPSRGEHEKQLKPPPSISCTIISKDDTYHHIPWDTHTHTSCYVIPATSTYPCTHHPRLGCTSLFFSENCAQWIHFCAEHAEFCLSTDSTDTSGFGWWLWHNHCLVGGYSNKNKRAAKNLGTKSGAKLAPSHSLWLFWPWLNWTPKVPSAAKNGQMLETGPLWLGVEKTIQERCGTCHVSGIEDIYWLGTLQMGHTEANWKFLKTEKKTESSIWYLNTKTLMMLMHEKTETTATVDFQQSAQQFEIICLLNLSFQYQFNSLPWNLGCTINYCGSPTQIQTIFGKLFLTTWHLTREVAWSLPSCWSLRINLEISLVFVRGSQCANDDVFERCHAPKWLLDLRKVILTKALASCLWSERHVFWPVKAANRRVCQMPSEK